MLLLRLSPFSVILAAVATTGVAMVVTLSPNRDSAAAEANWPARQLLRAPDADLEQRIAETLSEMTLEQKVGQLIMADISSIEKGDIRRYRLGAVLAGGNTGLGGKRYATQDEWLALADAYYLENAQGPDDGPRIPLLFGIDAVHGHNNVRGAVIFPYNVGLGAARDEALVRRVSAATACAVVAAGHDWTFAPTVATAKNLSWGRTYESFSEDPALVASLSAAAVDGFQSHGACGGRVAATAKHFIADGGTHGGKDQGDARISEAELIAEHAPGFYAALDAGVHTVMASYSSWNGDKVHGSRYLLTDILKGKMRFDGLVVGDWDAHAQLAGCDSTSCPAAINAGVDMLMAPTKWRELYDATLRQARSGEISPERLDDAVARILRVKYRLGLFSAPAPSKRAGAGEPGALASAGVRALARESVRKSQVLLKNEGAVLPLADISSLTVIGAAADDVAVQSGGWTLSWQGDYLSREEFPVAQTILESIREHAAERRIEVTFDPTDAGKTRPDAALVVIAEPPYAEFMGDVKTLKPPKQNRASLRALGRLANDGVPTVLVVVSGRPLWIDDATADADGVIAAWLPGTEGGGVADMIFGQTLSGEPVNFTSKLGFTWPREGDFTETDAAKNRNGPLYPYGYGLSYPVESARSAMRDRSVITTEEQLYE